MEVSNLKSSEHFSAPIVLMCTCLGEEKFDNILSSMMHQMTHGLPSRF